MLDAGGESGTEIESADSPSGIRTEFGDSTDHPREKRERSS